MEAYIIKSKEGKYLDDTQQQPFFVTEDICKTRLYRTFEKAREICSKKINCEVVEVTIAEGDLEQQLAEKEKEIKRQIAVNKEMDKMIGEKDKEIEELKTSIDYWKNEVFKKMEVKLTGVTKEKIQEIRKQVCDEIRNAIDNEEYELRGDNNRILSIHAKKFNEILDKIGKGSDNE